MNIKRRKDDIWWGWKRIFFLAVLTYIQDNIATSKDYRKLIFHHRSRTSIQKQKQEVERDGNKNMTFSSLQIIEKIMQIVENRPYHSVWVLAGYGYFISINSKLIFLDLVICFSDPISWTIQTPIPLHVQSCALMTPQRTTHACVI